MKPAFTLLEILTVIAIIAVLASLTIGGMGYYDDKMKYSRTEILIASIEQALEDYKSDNGAYPKYSSWHWRTRDDLWLSDAPFSW